MPTTQTTLLVSIDYWTQLDYCSVTRDIITSVSLSVCVTVCVSVLCVRSFISSFSESALRAVQVLRNADGGGGVSDFPEKSVTKV